MFQSTSLLQLRAFMKWSACCNHFVTDAWSLMDIPGSSCLSCLSSCQILITLIDSHFLNLTGSWESPLLCVNAVYFAFIVWSRWLLLTFCGLWSPHRIAVAWFLFKYFVCLLVICCCRFFFLIQKRIRDLGSEHILCLESETSSTGLVSKHSKTQTVSFC